MLEYGQLMTLRSAATESAPNRVKLAIKLTGKTQKQIAHELDFTEPHLSNICVGRVKEVSLTTARKLADYFGCQIEDLFPSRAA